MKNVLILFFLFFCGLVKSQCNQYYIYESFSSTLPTQSGTWVGTTMSFLTTPNRTGTNHATFNAQNDALRTPLITNPGVLSFWYRRSNNSTAWTLNIQTSPNGTTWTTRGSITTVTTTYTQYTLNIGALSLTNVYIRLVDARASGGHERYVDDLSITSTVSSENTLIPILGACSQTLTSTLSYVLTDNGGPAGPIAGGYSNNVNRTITLTPSDNTKKLNLSFSQMDLEIDYDYLYIYDGPNTSSPLLATLTGTVIPSDITATNSLGELTIRWTTDVNNIGVWGGFYATVTSIDDTPLPVELLYFEGTQYPTFNYLKWATASEHNSDYFKLEYSENGEDWYEFAKISAANNSNTKINYSYLHTFNKFIINYYRLVQYDIDGKYNIYGPISIDNRVGAKKIVKYLNTLGIEVNEYATGVIFVIYEDGSNIKVIK